MLKRLLVDRASLYGVATKGLQGSAGLITALLIVRFFTPAEQGYYYTFANLLALQVFVELGLSSVITTFSAHEWARLSLDADGKIRGDRDALSRLKTLAVKTATWYLYGGIVIFLGLLAIGSWFFASQSEQYVDWSYPWLAMCAVAATSFVLTPAWALLTGCGQLAILNAFRIGEIVLRYAALWSCIALGASLWSAVVAIAVALLAGFAFLFLRYRRFFGSLAGHAASGSFSWFRELAPLQVRIAVSWISGYFAFSVFVPVMFHFLGAEEAGRMGMTWALIAGLSGISATWLQTQAPNFATMVARKEYRALDLAATRMAVIGCSVFLMITVAALAGFYALAAYRPDISGRLTSIGPIALFLLAELLHQVSMVQSTYLRAFKQEPFLWISVASGLMIGGGTILLVPQLGALGAAVSYLTGVAVAAAWGTWVFLRRRRDWTLAADQSSLDAKIRP